MSLSYNHGLKAHSSIRAMKSGSGSQISPCIIFPKSTIFHNFPSNAKCTTSRILETLYHLLEKPFSLLQPRPLIKWCRYPDPNPILPSPLKYWSKCIRTYIFPKEHKSLSCSSHKMPNFLRRILLIILPYFPKREIRLSQHCVLCSVTSQTNGWINLS
jgi:hypothetical protein